jgi:hypothetical protein
MIGIIGLLTIFGSCKTVPNQLAASDKYRLIWNDNPATTITIAWDQNDSVKNPAVYYGRADQERKYWKYEGNQTASRVARQYDMNTHFTKLSGLKGNTAYYFVIKDDRGVSERFWFKTAPDTPQPFTFIAGGDTKSADGPLEAGRNSSRVVAKLRPLFVYFNGDFTTGDGTNADNWKKWLTDWQQLTTTTDGRMVPIVPIHGNHENGDRANLYYIFNTPYQENDSTKIYYSLSLGGDFFHMTQLNSEIEEGGAQREWLKKDLEKHHNFTFKIAGFHKPFCPHTKSKKDNPYQYDQWVWLFQENRLNLGFDADTHMQKITYPVVPDSSANSYQGFIRNDQTGTMYVGEGSWGVTPRENNNDKPWTLTSGSFNHINWIHVLPKTKSEEAHIKIFTIPTANYNEQDSLILYNRDLQALTENNLFEVPQNITLHLIDSTETYVRFPYLKRN